MLQKANEPREADDAIVKAPARVDSACSLQTAYTEKDVFYDAVSKFDTESLLNRFSRTSLPNVAPSGNKPRQPRRFKCE